ncbi:MAG: MazG nucleotide pyrophosphohydrolase domain-containing protein [Microthrixaceae bacterium]
MTPRRAPGLTVVGLGPGGRDLLTVETQEALRSAEHLLIRTERHPAALGWERAEYLDRFYEAATTMDDAYRGIVERVVEVASGHGPDAGGTVYAVPGSPLVAERTVRMLLEDERIDVTVLGAMSFLDLAWVRLGIDPIDAGVTVVDGHRFAADAAGVAGAVMICQCDSPMVLGDVKVAVEDGPARPAVVLQRLGLHDERIFEVPWSELDRSFEPDHLTSVFVHAMGAPVAAELASLHQFVGELRLACPWDREQTNASLRPYALEECHELLAAVDAYDPDDGTGADELCAELGDVLYQVCFHAAIAAEDGWFTLADVAAGVHRKLLDRHPHLFGPVETRDPGRSAAELARTWEVVKAASSRRGSIGEDIPPTLGALAHATKVLRRAQALDPSRVNTAIGLVGAGAPIAAPGDAAALGAALLDHVLAAGRADLDAEDALRVTVRRLVAALDAGGDTSPDEFVAPTSL